MNTIAMDAAMSAAKEDAGKCNQQSCGYTMRWITRREEQSAVLREASDE